jgi:hypothetical protein
MARKMERCFGNLPDFEQGPFLVQHLIRYLHLSLHVDIMISTTVPDKPPTFSRKLKPELDLAQTLLVLLLAKNPRMFSCMNAFLFKL